MSLIFDALQRSEAERSGVDLAALPAATEVLRLAELRALSERRSCDTVRGAGRERKAQSQIGHFRHKQAAIGATAVAVPGPAEPSLNDQRLEVFGQFQSLQVSVPAQSRLVCLTDNQSLAAEKFRFVGITLQHLRRDRPLKKVLITSTIPQEGKTTVSANLACALARRTQQRTLLVEGDVRRPSLSQIFGLERMPGICECLQGERDLMTSIYHLEGPGLWFLPAGSAPRILWNCCNRENCLH